ncbi:MAG: diaminopimelate epimerase [Lachnospiraceae bacterium]|nr:diaminopimelate epimerase [Lachnospiraceae bacterium]
MKFTKMHGCGNDYVYIDCFRENPIDPEQIAIKLSDRHFGIGGDGVIFIRPSEVADCMMDMYNLDGSRGKMCGNGIRCVGKYAYDHGIVNKTEINIETLSGIKKLILFPGENGKIEKVKVDMGSAEFDPAKIPLNVEILTSSGIKYENGPIKKYPLEINGKTLKFTFVSMGNPHAVTFIDDTAGLDIAAYGPKAECHGMFPEKANIEFIQIVDREHINMRVWERGSGETFACGTGACAAVVACVENGLTECNVEVSLLGGKLNITYNKEDGRVFMTGPAVEVFNGEISE